MEQNSRKIVSERNRVAKLHINNRTYDVYEGANTVGRNREAVINIKHLNVSQNHAIIITLNGNHFISDLNSSNGTFCDNKRIIPFKLEQLKHNTRIKLGDIVGIYTTQGLDLSNTQTNTQSTQDLTQSIYASDTQILINPDTPHDVEDIHEAPTQAILFTDFKIPRSVKEGEEDIHEAVTQIVDRKQVKEGCLLDLQGHSSLNEESNDGDSNLKVPLPADLLDDINDDHLPFLENNDNYPDDAEAKEGSDEGEATDCEDNTSTNVCSSTVQVKPQPVDDKSNDSTEFFQIGEEKCDLVSNLHEANEDKVKKNEDNKTKDSAQDMNAAKENPAVQDEETDCEDDIPSGQSFELKNNSIENPNSNDSSDFFKTGPLIQDSNQSSAGSDDTSTKQASSRQNSSELIHFKKKKILQLSSDSDSESDDFSSVRKRKSAMIICTQDLESDKSLQHKEAGTGDQDNYIITETDSETEMDASSRNTLEKSIPATQNQSTADLNDTDCIPPTQDVKSKAKSLSQLTNVSSEDSFRFGLTQMMSEELQLSSKDIEPIVPPGKVNETSLDDDTQLYGPTQQVCTVGKYLERSLIDENPSNKTGMADADLYGPTQKITAEKQFLASTIDQNPNIDLDGTDVELYGPTQKISIEKLFPSSTTDQNSSNKAGTIESMADTDLYGPTQKITTEKKILAPTIDHKPNIDIDGTDIELYGPTQKISTEKQFPASTIDQNCSNTPGPNQSMTDTELYGPTQKIIMEKQFLASKIDQNTSTIDLDHTDIELYGPTQKIHNSVIASDIYLANTEKILPLNIKDKNPLETSDVYGVATQQIPELSVSNIYNIPTQQISKSQDKADLYNQPTEKFNIFNLTAVEDDVFDKPTQIIPVSDGPRVQKKFSFKKIECNLDESLNSLLKHDPVRDSIVVNVDDVLEQPGEAESKKIDARVKGSKELKIPSQETKNNDGIKETTTDKTNMEKQTEEIPINNIKEQVNMQNQQKQPAVEEIMEKQETKELEGKRMNKANLIEETATSLRKSTRAGRRKATSIQNLPDKKQNDDPAGQNKTEEKTVVAECIKNSVKINVDVDTPPDVNGAGNPILHVFEGEKIDVGVGESIELKTPRKEIEDNDDIKQSGTGKYNTENGIVAGESKKQTAPKEIVKKQNSKEIPLKITRKRQQSTGRMKTTLLEGTSRRSKEDVTEETGKPSRKSARVGKRKTTSSKEISDKKQIKTSKSEETERDYDVDQNKTKERPVLHEKEDSEDRKDKENKTKINEFEKQETKNTDGDKTQVHNSKLHTKFYFKKIEYNLDESLTSLLKHDPVVEGVQDTVEMNADNIEAQSDDIRPSNPVSHVLEQSCEGESEKIDVRVNERKTLSKEIEVNDGIHNIGAKKRNKTPIHNVKEQLNTLDEEMKAEDKKQTATEGTVEKQQTKEIPVKVTKKKPQSTDKKKTIAPEGKRRMSKEDITEETGISSRKSVRVGKRKVTSSEAISDKKPAKINKQDKEEIQDREDDDENKTKNQESDDEKTKNSNGNTKKTTVRKRRVSTPSDESFDPNIDTKSKRVSKKLITEDVPKKPSRTSRKKILSTDQLNDIELVKDPNQEEKNDVSCNSTNTEANQSIALLETKAAKSKKTGKLDHIEELYLTAPKYRRSMAVVDQNETVSSDSVSTSTARSKKAGNPKPSRKTQAETNKKTRAETSKVTKRKQIPESTASESSDTGSSSTVPSTPKKQKLLLDESALLSSTERAARRQKPKVVFTMMDSPQMESFIRQLGGSVVDSVGSCSVLVTEHIKRSQKFLCAIGLGKPICSPRWIMASKKSHDFLDPWDYILQDPEAEAKWSFTLKESLKKSKEKKLLEDHYFLIQVSIAVDVLKGAVESCGGKCITKIPPNPPNNTFIISSPTNQSKYKRIIKQYPNVKVVEAEAIFDGVLRQELRFSNHYLN